MATSRKGKRRRLYESAVAALLTSKDCITAAQACGISYSTLNRWRAEPEFQTLYDAAKRDVLESVKNNLRMLGVKAVGTLNTTIDDASAAVPDRLSASKFVVDRILSFELTDDFAARITAIESGVTDAQ